MMMAAVRMYGALGWALLFDRQRGPGRVAWLLVISLIASSPAVEYLSGAAALELAFGADATVTLLVLAPTPEQARTVLTQARSSARGKLGGVFVATVDGRLLGTAYIDHVIGRTEFITWMAVIGPDSRLRQIEILIYREPIGGEIIDPQWRRGSVGRGADKPLRRGREITNIAGATLSVDAITERARFILAQHAHVTLPLLPAAAEKSPAATAVEAEPVRRAATIGSAALSIIVDACPAATDLADAAIAAALREAAVINQWDPASELALVNRQITTPMSTALAQAFLAMDQAVALSEGAFDPTVGGLIQRWQQAAEAHILPNPKELTALRATIGWHTVQRSAGIVTRPRDVHLDFGGLAKGRYLDQAAKVFASLPTGKRAHLSCGSSSHRVVGSGVAIAVALRDPRDDTKILLEIPVQPGQGLGVAHSGGRTFRIGDQTFSHLIDPRSGQPVAGPRMAAVLAPSAELADILDTAFCILPIATAIAIADRLDGVAALLWDGTRLVGSSRWPTEIPTLPDEPSTGDLPEASPAGR